MDIVVMDKAIALTRRAVPAIDGYEIARLAIVFGSALALILAGPVFPL